MGERPDKAKDFYKAVGQRIRFLRKKRRFSLEELGLEIGFTRMQVHRIEAGYNITLKTILKLSIALQTKPEMLLKTNLKFTSDDLEKLTNPVKNSNSQRKAV